MDGDGKQYDLVERTAVFSERVVEMRFWISDLGFVSDFGLRISDF